MELELDDDSGIEDGHETPLYSGYYSVSLSLLLPSTLSQGVYSLDTLH